MMEVTQELESKLALTNEAVQIQVCSDYNFHSEESFKVNYWTRVILTLAGHSNNHLGGISCVSLKHWWTRRITPRSLPGLRKIIFTAVHQSSDIVVFSRLKVSYNSHFNISSSAPAPSKPGKSLVSRIATSVWRLAVGGDASDGEDSPTSAASSIDENEVIFSTEILKKVSGKVLQSLQRKAGLDGGPLESILVTESDVLKTVTEQLDESQQIEEPFCRMSYQTVNLVVVSCLIDMWGALPFTVNAFNCLKLPPVDSNEVPDPVTDRDKAYLMSEIASEKLMAQETQLTDQWNALTEKLKDHLKAGRKPLALAALKERKMIEQRLEEIQIYKLKLTESTSVTQTAIIQQAVIEAVAVGNQAARATLETSVEDVEEILQQADDLRNEVKQISEAMTGTTTDLDDAVLLEYEKLVRDREEEHVMKEAAEKETLLDMIPSPPTEGFPPEKERASPIKATPDVIVPEEWFSDIQ